jgi:hypothetical protein
MKVVPWTDKEISIIEMEMKVGPGWSKRVADRLPTRTHNAIKSYASQCGMIQRFGTSNSFGKRASIKAAYVPPVQLTRRQRELAPRDQRVPAFLNDLFLWWAAREELRAQPAVDTY